MKPRELKVARIGNSRGIRLPADTLERYQIGDSVIMDERADGILIRPRRAGGDKLSWEGTADAMASAAEDWTAWDSTLADGLESIPWAGSPAKSVAEGASPYAPRSRRRKLGRDDN